MLMIWIGLWILQISNLYANPPNVPGYQYSYFVRNVHTGDYKTQEETRDGDTVKGSYSVGEPNGDLRVVTYEADKNTGFNAQVQIQPGGVKLLSDAYNNRGMAEIMRNLPRYQKRTGFPQLEIKVVPTLNRQNVNNTTTPAPLPASEIYQTEDIESENKEDEQGQGYENLYLTTIQTDLEDHNNKNVANSDYTEQTTVIQEEGSSKESEQIKLQSTESSNTTNYNGTVENKNLEQTLENQSINYEDHLCKVICNRQNDNMKDEGRAHLKPNEDRVQVEMEQIIRAEMQEPTAVNLGIPYEQFQQSDSTNQKHFFTKPLSTDYNPIVSKDDKQNSEKNPLRYGQNYESQPLQQMMPPPYYQSKVILLPFNINSNDYLSLKNPTSQQNTQIPSGSTTHFPRDEQNSKTLFPSKDRSPQSTIPASWHNHRTPNTEPQGTKMARIYPMYTTGLAFIVMPQMQ